MLVSDIVFAFALRFPPGINAHQWGLKNLDLHQGAAPPTALNRGSFMLLIQLSLSHSINMVGYIGLGFFSRVTNPSAFPT